MGRSFNLLALAVPLAACSYASAEPSLWILQPPDKIVEHDSATFAPVRTVSVPPSALKNPDALAVNRAGQILFTFPLNVADSDRATDEGIWLWDGREVRTFRSTSTTKPLAPDRSQTVTETKRVFFLSANGESLYILDNTFRRKQNDDVDLAVVTTYSVRQTDLRGEQPTELLSVTLPPCECTTGVCSETCPEAQLWAPPDGIGDFFVITRWIPGQIQTTYEESALYKRVNGVFSATPWPSPLDSILDAADGGNLLLELVPDAGCCGWINGSDDQALLWRDGNSIRIFDERERFRNSNYDISFAPMNARFSPDRHLAALTIACDGPPDSELRLADSGKDDPEELARIRQVRTELPEVEVLRLGLTPAHTARLPRAQLAGWLSADKLVIVSGNRLLIVSVDGKTIAEPRISVSNPAWVFVR